MTGEDYLQLAHVTYVMLPLRDTNVIVGTKEAGRVVELSRSVGESV